jgi:uncharacterized RDD family membrane protein YckC
MTCPVCQAAVPGGNERCPACGSMVAPFVEGSLAPEPRPRVEPLREIPGLRKRERTWKDEVRERVRDRRTQRKDGEELPLFPDVDDVPIGPADGESADESLGERTPETRFSESRENDLPLRPLEEVRPLRPASEPLTPDPGPRSPRDRVREAPDFASEAPEDDEPEEWSLGPVPGAAEAAPVERPARAGERLFAAAVDLAVLGTLAFVIVYLAGRAARVGVAGLMPVWPWLAGYVAFLGLMYAAYFTGATGQTIGKMAAGLRVVDAAGSPPGYVRAMGRAALGSLGIALLGGGLVPLFVDPARRAFHDRALKTRVIKG